MSRRTALAVAGLALLAVGAMLGFFEVGDGGCGNALFPDYSRSQLLDQLAPYTGNEQDCRDAVASRRPLAYGALGLGGVALLMAVALPEPSRSND